MGAFVFKPLFSIAPVILARKCSPTGNAMPRRVSIGKREHSGVLGRKLVPILAVGLCGVPRIYATTGGAITHVVRLSSHVQVTGVKAPFIVTGMKNGARVVQGNSSPNHHREPS